jgi:hypothetical protein
MRNFDVRVAAIDENDQQQSHGTRHPMAWNPLFVREGLHLVPKTSFKAPVLGPRRE